MAPVEKRFTFIATDQYDKGDWTTRREEIWSRINAHVANASHERRAYCDRNPAKGFGFDGRACERLGIAEPQVPAQRSTPVDDLTPVNGHLSGCAYEPLEELVAILKQRSKHSPTELVDSSLSDTRLKKRPGKRVSVHGAQMRGRSSALTHKSSRSQEDIPHNGTPIVPIAVGGGYSAFLQVRPEDHDPLIQAIHHEAIYRNWPLLLPHDAKDGHESLARTFLGFESQSEAFYYCSIYVACLQYAIRRRGDHLPMRLSWMSLRLKVKALRCLQTEIDDLRGGLAPDVLLNTIAALASQEPCPVSQPCWTRARNESPIAQFQLMNLVRYMRPLEAHGLAMYQLVGQRGGLTKIGAFGLPNLLALSVSRHFEGVLVADLSSNDLFAANGAGTAAKFPPFWSPEGYLPVGKLDELDPTLFKAFGTSFYELHTPEKGLLLPFLDLLPKVTAVTFALANYRHGQPNNVQDSDHSFVRNTMETANLIHHRILGLTHNNRTSSLSVVDGHQQRTSEGTTALEILRLTTLIYSIFTIFPLGLESGILGMLAARLKDLLGNRSHEMAAYPTHYKMWIWVLGAIGALADKNLVAWFVDELKMSVKVFCDSDFSRLLDGLRGFLWWDYIFLSYLQDLWSLLTSDLSQDGH